MDSRALVDDMDMIIPILMLTVSGFVFSILLIFASNALKTDNNEKFNEIRSCLPGINCSVCGYANCDEYARAIIDGEAITKCRPGGKAAKEKLEIVLETKK